MPYLDKLIDWKDFEFFVRDLYAEDPNLVVQHDVMLQGKSGASRQIDVLITVRTKLHSYMTVVECKRWKDRVDRSRIDILFATVEDVNASKGVMFTTSGYEEGAKDYAKSKGIDIFVVRELTSEEWGLPGRAIHFYLHVFASKMTNLRMPGAMAIPLVDVFPRTLELGITIGKDVRPDPVYDLYSTKDGRKGLNLTAVLLALQREVTPRIGDSIPLLEDGRDGARLAVLSDVEVDLDKAAFKQLRYQWGALNLTKIECRLVTLLQQSVFDFDRGAKYDIALVVDNFVARQKHIVYKEKDANITVVSEDIRDTLAKRVAEKPDDALQNGSIFRVYTQPWVSFEVQEEDRLVRTERIRISPQFAEDGTMTRADVKLPAVPAKP
ncbi:MAG TPA: restriction endonuclease [bacterium]|nr:restriction endonuclease [bacterium]